jgi:hypothetical protein
LAQTVRLQVGSKRAIGQHGMNLCRHRVDVRRIEERIASSNDLRNARRIGSHDGGAARHRFKRRQSEAFLERGQAGQLAVPVERSEIRVRQPPRKQHVRVVQSLALIQCAKAPARVPIYGADENKLVSGANGQRKPGVRGDEVRNVFPCVETAGMQDERARDSVTCTQRGNSVGGSAPGLKTSLAAVETTTTRSACIGNCATACARA